MRIFPRALGALILLCTLVRFPPPASAATPPAVSIAPQAGVPGTPFVVLGIGFAPQTLQTVAIGRAGTTVAVLSAQADNTGRVALTLDSTGYEPDVA